MLPVEQGRHVHLPRHRHVCRLCHAGALSNEIQTLLRVLLLQIFRAQEEVSLVSLLATHCSGVRARLVQACTCVCQRPAHGQQVHCRLLLLIQRQLSHFLSQTG